MDFSPSSLQALGFALDLARRSNGKATLLNVVEWLAEEDPMVSAHFNVPEIRGHMREDAEHRLHALGTQQVLRAVDVETSWRPICS